MYRGLFQTAESRSGLAQMLRASFPGSAEDPASAAGSVTGPGPVPFTKAPGTTSFKGFLHPSMLSFEPQSWDLFFVYESDFKREVKAIITDGLIQSGLQVQLVEQLPASSPVPDFAWKPDGPYRAFVTIAAVMFISITTTQDAALPLPQWLAQDLSKMSGIYVHHPNQLRRGLGALKTTILASKQNRMIDPLMLDFMLQGLCSSPALDALAGGSGSAGGSGGAVDLAGAEAFISRYNASVNYDRSLELKDRAALRQRNLLDPQKCSPEMKRDMRAAVEEASSFEESGLSLEIMGAPEFWIGCVFVLSSHLQWVKLGKTSKESCSRTLRILIAMKKNGKALSASSFKALARRMAFVTNLIRGIFGRRSVSNQIIEDMVSRVVDGMYNDDLDNLIGDCDESAPSGNDLEMDAYLVEVCSFVSDTLELQEAQGSTNKEEQARAEAAASMSEAQWFMAEVERDTGLFLKARSERVKLTESVNAKEKEWQDRRDTNVKQATGAFVEKYVPIEKYDPATFPREFRKRLDAIAKDLRCEVNKILAMYWLDLCGA